MQKKYICSIAGVVAIFSMILGILLKLKKRPTIKVIHFFQEDDKEDASSDLLVKDRLKKVHNDDYMALIYGLHALNQFNKNAHSEDESIEKHYLKLIKNNSCYGVFLTPDGKFDKDRYTKYMKLMEEIKEHQS